jgi:cyclophilin family peptidyl-prolyl cis-trans isomerase
MFARRTTRWVSAALAAMLCSPVVHATDVLLQTPLGDVEIELYDDEAPQTVANFLNYVRDGDYGKSFIHRSVRGFVVQGGGFRFIDNVASPIPTDPPVVNEPGISNTRGTIAMAKQPNDPNSATSQWFINVGDNASQLDGQNGGFTVFGKVRGNGMDVIDAINALQVWNAGSPFNELPLIDYNGVDNVTQEHLVMTRLGIAASIPINQGMSDSWYSPATNGQGFFIIVWPQIRQVFLAWFTYDTERPPADVTAMLGEPGHRWLTAQGGYEDDTAVLDVYVSRGGVFDSGSPAPVASADGTMILEFEDCNSATISYDIPSVDRQGEIAIQRVAPDNIALCEALAGSGQSAGNR